MANAPRFTILTAARLFDGVADGPIDSGAVLVEDDRIAAIGRRAEVRAPDGATAELVDYGDATILPGLVDGHTHPAAPGDGSPGEVVGATDEQVLLLHSVAAVRAMLSTGVTTIRDNGNKGRVAFNLRDAIQRGIVPGPRMVICGRPLAITGGHLWFFGEQVDGADAGRAAVRRLMKEGADFIKITATGGSTVTSHVFLPSFTKEELGAIIDETHRHGKLAATHVASTVGIENALDAGVDMLIHCNFFNPDGSHTYRPELIDRAAEAGVWINPTLYAWATEIELIEANRRAGGAPMAGYAAQVDKARAQLDLFVEITGRMVRAGAKVMAGSDTPWRFAKPAWGLAGEIGVLGRTGMTNRDAIVAGSSGSAESIGVGDVAGRLAAGRQADVAVFAGDVLADLDALRRPVAVFQAGRPFEVATYP